MIFDHANMFLAADSELSIAMVAGGGIGIGIIVFLALDVTAANITEAILAAARKWHGSIDEQFSAINNLVNRVTEHTSWAIPSDLLTQLTTNRDQIRALIEKCKTTAVSQDDRAHRNVLLKTTVGICLRRAKLWAYGQYATGIMTAEDIHSLGFLLPGETSKYRDRTKATDIIAEVKVGIINADNIHVVVDQSADENAARVTHGWPAGVKFAVIVIVAADGITEVLRLQTTHLHNDIEMPEGSRGKQFIIKAAFLKHIDDVPKFGNTPTFSMPLTTEDLAAALDRQNHEEFEAHVKETELHRQEVEKLQAELNNAKANK